MTVEREKEEESPMDTSSTPSDANVPKAKENEVPKGKISCLLCRGFISYKNSDRTRFRDHMANEHDVKFDSDVILAISVMSAKEKQYIVQSAMQRLNEVSNNQIPTQSDALIPKPTPTSTLPSQITKTAVGSSGVQSSASGAVIRGGITSSRGRGQVQSSSTVTSLPRGGTRGGYRGSVVRPQRGAASAAAGKVPFNIQNMSISISVVDQTVKCSQCPMTFKNSNLLAEHTKSVHLARFASLGLSITAPGEKKLAQDASASMSPGVKRQRPPEAVRTPPTKVMVQSRGGGIPRGRGRGNPSTVVRTMVKTEPGTGGTGRGGQNSRIPIKAQASGQEKVDPVIKCNDCAQFIKQSVFKEHKMSHLQETGDSNNSNDANLEEKTSTQEQQPVTKKLVRSRPPEKNVDYVDLGNVSDEEEITDITKKKVLEKKIPCPSCDVMFATTMSLKMHMNLSHPVKNEAVETEQLLEEAQDDSEDTIREEMNAVGTSEMLDDLVNFLNEI